MNRFDAIVIGAGQAAPSLAWRLTAAGMTVAVVERKLVRGTCVNTGCTPTKTLVASAQAAHSARRAADHGVLVDDAIRVDRAKVKARADAVAANSRLGLDGWLRNMKGCTLIEGYARFEARDRLCVRANLLTAPRIFINGPALPPLPGINDVPFPTNRTMLDLDQVPEHTHTAYNDFEIVASDLLDGDPWRDLFVLCPIMLVGGVAWISVLSTLTVGAQQASPPWVRARALAV